MKTINNKLLDCFKDMGFKWPYYYEIIRQFNIIEENSIPTMGVQFTVTGIKMYYNNDFVETLKKEELMFIIIHEVCHVLFDHGSRLEQRDQKIANIAQDMCINAIIKDEAQKPIFKDKLKDPEGIFFPPKEYDGKLIYEFVYDYIYKKAEEEKSKNGQSGNNQSPKQSGNGQSEHSQSGNNQSPQDKEKEAEKKNMENIKKAINSEKGESIDTHLPDEVSPEIKKTIIKNIIEGIKSRGYNTGDFEELLKKLQKPKKNYLKTIMSSLSQMIGDEKFNTWSRANRKNLPMPGYKKIKNKINVLLDVSGSMNGEFEKVLKYINYNNIECNMFQCDTQIKKTENIKSSKQLQKIKITGLGGTELQPGINLITENNKYNQYSTVILTDGYCDTLNVKNLKKKCLIISSEKKPSVIGKNYKMVCINEKN